MSPLHQGHSIPQHYSCVKGAFSLRFPVAGDKDIHISKAEWNFCCQDGKSATPYSTEHQVPDTCQHLKHGLSAKNPNDNFLTQVIGESTRGGALLDLLLVNKLAGGVEVEGSFGCNPEIV